MAPEANPNTLDSEAIKYLGDTNKKLVMKMFDDNNNIVMLFEMSVVDNDNIKVSNASNTHNTQIGKNNTYTQ